MKVLDLYCCGGGASVGMSLLGMDVLGVDHDPDACRTHLAAGLPTIRADLTRPVPVSGPFDGVWASPPCTAFSMAGKGAGREAADRLIGAVLAERWEPWPDEDPTVWLVLPTMAAVLDQRPGWVAMENVPPTLPVMEACARVLERHGYRATTCVLSAETFGVAQTRKRAFLMASRVGAVTVPEPTHQSYRHGEPAQAEATLFGELEPWVSMAEALGWGTPERPYFVLPTAGGLRGGADEQVGGSGARRQLYELRDRETWVMDRRQTGAPVVSINDPAPTLTGAAGAKGVVVWRHRPDPMPFVPRSWTEDRPATTLAGDPRCFQPGGHHEPGEQSENAIRLTVAEAARLQAFPADHPWQGSRTSVFRQIGNAVPPPLAAVVAASAAGLDWREPVAAYLAELYAEPVTAEAAA